MRLWVLCRIVFLSLVVDVFFLCFCIEAFWFVLLASVINSLLIYVLQIVVMVVCTKDCIFVVCHLIFISELGISKVGLFKFLV